MRSESTSDAVWFGLKTRLRWGILGKGEVEPQSGCSKFLLGMTVLGWLLTQRERPLLRNVANTVMARPAGSNT